MKKPTLHKELYVTEISFEAQEEDLRKLFALCGTVNSVHMVTDPKSGQFKGTAFIRMATAAEARDAVVTLDGTRLINRCIVVQAAQPKAALQPPATKPPADKPRRRERPRRQRK